MKIFQKNPRRTLHYTMSLIGGISGSYAILIRGGNFGAAETTNLIELFLDMARFDLPDILIRLGILCLYSSSIVLAHLAEKKLPSGNIRLCLAAESLCILLAGFLPISVHPLVALYPIFAMSALQWQTFTCPETYNSSTIFSTNNLKQALLSWTDYRLERNPSQTARAVFFTMTLAFFHAGVLLGWFAVQAFGTRAIWTALLPLLWVRSTLSGLKSR